MWEAVLRATLSLLSLTLGVLYAAVVLAAARAERWQAPFRWDWRAAEQSVDRALLWLGVMAAAGIVRLAKAVFELLVESSAEVGEWCLRRRGGHAEFPFRSRLF